VEIAVRTWMWMKQPTLYCNGIFKLAPKWDKGIEVFGDYNERMVMLWWKKWAPLNIVIILI
jgi:hypothetical protein